MTGARHRGDYDAAPFSAQPADFSAFVAVLKRSRMLIAAVVLGAVSVAQLYVWFKPPEYRAEALLQVESRPDAIGSLFDRASPTEEETTPISAEIELIRSRRVLGEAVRRIDGEVLAEPRYLPLFGAAFARGHSEPGLADPWFGLGSYAWGGENIRVKRLDVVPALLDVALELVAGRSGTYSVHDAEGAQLFDGRVGVLAQGGGVTLVLAELHARPGTRFMLMRRSPANAADALRRVTAVREQGKQSGVLQLSVRADSPQAAALATNAVAAAYLQQNVSRRSREAGLTLAFIERQLPRVRARLETAEDALNRFRLASGSADLELETQGRLTRLLEVDKQITELRQKRDETAQQFAPGHPRMLALAHQEARLQTAARGLNDWVRKLPETQRNILRLSREVQVNTQLYTSLLDSLQEQRVEQGGSLGTARIVDSSIPPTSPTGPSRSLVLVMGLIVGLFAGAAVALLRESMRQPLSDARWLERRFGLPVLGVVPHSSRQLLLSRPGPMSRRAVLAQDDPADRAVESLRALPHMLRLPTPVYPPDPEAASAVPHDHSLPPQWHDSLIAPQGAVWLICGAVAGAGKSFLSANLAVLMARSEVRVLLVDADLRNGSLHRSFGAQGYPGLSDLLDGNQATPQRLAASSLDFLPRGSLHPVPAALFTGGRLARQVRHWASHYDLVLIDTTPVLEVADALALAPLADACLLVIKPDHTKVEEVETAVQRLVQAGGNVRGVVLNDMRPAPGASYGYGYGTR
jgi:tyrosine-protein kinase Etk/Wzc